jgi:hypothetical protein
MKPFLCRWNLDEVITTRWRRSLLSRRPVCCESYPEVSSIESVNASQQLTMRDHPIEIGSSIAVRTRYLGAWSGGFEVAKHVDRGCLIRRVSDGSVLPDVFQWSDIRSESRDRDVA